MKKQGKIQLLDIVPIFILAGIFIIFTVASNGATLSSYNLKLLCTNVVPVIIGSLGCIFVIALGGTDISIGASAALCSSIAAVISAQTAGWVAIPVTIILSTALGALIGFIVTKFHHVYTGNPDRRTWTAELYASAELHRSTKRNQLCNIFCIYNYSADCSDRDRMVCI